MSFRDWLQQYRLVALAVLGSLTFHGGLLLAGSYRGTYDAYVHIFFADHYARSWWNPWDTRWYTGFTLFSYPPLTHQLTALISKFSNLPFGFITVMLVSTLITTVGVYRYSRLWVPHRPAAYAALLAVFSSSIAETVHVFGQLPTMFVIGILLNALPFVWYWVERGRVRDLARALAILMVAAAGHHVTTLFGMVFFSGPILATLLLRKFRTPHIDETEIVGQHISRIIPKLMMRRIRRVTPAIWRCGIFGIGLILVLVITVLPYWLWSRSDPITQITIPHSSRDSFLQNQPAGLMFFLIPWGILLFVLPYAFYKGFGSSNWILASSLAMLALLGTGGTTPIPALLLRGSFYILTLDRFTFWGTIIILPLAGQFVESLLHGRLGGWIAAHLGDAWRIGFSIALGLSLVGVAIFTANLTQYRKFQPAPVDMTPIVEFLAKDNHDDWRYMTLGFGDQMAWLSAQTTALNVEGNYHSARRLPELTSTPVERLDGAKFTNIPGLGSLEEFVTNPERYNLKYIFVNDAFYEPLLYFSGWHKLGRLANNVDVWERADVPPLPVSIPVVIYPAWQRFMWGILPVGSLFVTALTFFITGVVVPRLHFGVTDLPIIRRIARWHIIRYWLVDSPATVAKPASEDWQMWKKFMRRWFPGIHLQPLPRRFVYGFLLAIFLGLLAVIVGSIVFQRSLSPESVILSYYDDIDFKRFSESYHFLQTDLTQEEYLRWLSLRGGLLASFAKLQNLYTDIQPRDDGLMTANVRAEWLTSLGPYTEQTIYTLAHSGLGWRIILDVEAPPLPRETFITTSSNNYYFDLPLTSLDETALNRGVLDRSLLSASQPRLVYAPNIPIGFTPMSYDAGRITGRFTGLLSVVGAVVNLDSYPAQATITAVLRDAGGTRLAETSVMDVMLHQLLPGEITMYRIDFSGANATSLLDISQIASVEVVIRGVPTSHNLQRPITLVSPGILYNSGTQSVDIPQVLVSYFDSSNNLVWVNSIYLQFSIFPAQTGTFEIPNPPDDLQILNVPIIVDGPRLETWSSSIPSYVIQGYSR